MQLYLAVIQKNPDRQYVWNNLGRVYNLLERYSLAVPAFQTAIQKNPYDPYAYNNLGQAYRGLGQYNDAVKEFLKQIEINPLDRYSHINLAAVYVQQKKYDLAQKEYQTALQITPNNFGLYVGLGTADLGLHEDDAALAAFDKALEKSPSPLIWNDVAYYLADNNSHLDLAEQYSSNSIRTTEAQLNAISLDTVSPSQTSLVSSIASYWDTMGWIKFKQGNLKAAEDYIHAAWMLDDHSEVGDHLGQIYEKEGRKQDASNIYAVALGYPNPPPDLRPRLIALVGEKQASARVAADIRRVFDLPNPQNLDAVAQFWVLLSPASDASVGSVSVGVRAIDAKLINVDKIAERSLQSASDAGTKSSASQTVESTLRNYAKTVLTSAKFPYTFLAGDAGKLLIRGTLACVTGSDSGCIFTAYSADEARRLAYVPSPSSRAQ